MKNTFFWHTGDKTLNAATTISRPAAKFVDRMVGEGKWQSEVIPAEVVGLTRDVTVLRGERKTNLIKYDEHGDAETHCPSRWSDRRTWGNIPNAVPVTSAQAS